MDFLMSRFLLSTFLVCLLSACGSSNDSDFDNDGVANDVDAFPRNSLESMDSDGDGVGDNSDAFPNDNTETKDSDGDGIGDNSDTYPHDFDNDSVPDATDVFPQDVSEYQDSDGDGVGDNADAFPNDKTEFIDSDGDGTGDHSDDYPNDYDNDAVPDVIDEFPQDPNESQDTDKDGVGDNADVFPKDPTEQYDSDCDGLGDNSGAIFGPETRLSLGIGIGIDHETGMVETGLDEGEVLSANGSTEITVNIVEQSCEFITYSEPHTVYFSSQCSQQGLAEFIPSSVTATGVASSTYVDKGCGQEAGKTDDLGISVRYENEGGHIYSEASLRFEIEVAAAQVGAIQFISATPTDIALKGLSTESTPSLSIVSFKVVDVGGNPMPNRIVKFELDHEYGGAALSVESSETDYLGNVHVYLIAGLSPVSLRVQASLDVHKENGELDYSISTQSDSIRLTTSLGSQNNFTIIADTLNPHAWNFSGTEVNITAFLGGIDNNSVVDGTKISFRSTGGEIPFSCSTVSGSCSVKWRSGYPKPVDGYVTITAYGRGRGDYQDTNGNGLFDLNERYVSYAEAWIDGNGNGSYDFDGLYQADLDINDDGINEFGWDASVAVQEDYIDSNNNQLFDSIPPSKYQGINCSQAAKEDGHCEALFYASTSLRLQMSASNDVYIEGPFLMADSGEYDFSKKVACVDAGSESHSVAWRIADSEERRNHLPEGAAIDYTDSNLVVTDEHGFGDVLSTAPIDVLPVWEVKAENTVLTAQQRKYKYLNERAHLVEMTVSKPIDVDPELTHGLLTINVESMDGHIHLGLSQQLSLGYKPEYCSLPVLELEL